MKKICVLLLGSLIIYGCSTKPPVVIYDVPKVDPVWPEQITPVNIKWKVVNVNDKPYVGTSYQESLQFRIWMEDVYRYIKDANSMICFYRTHLNEQKCEKYNNE
mgnify:CR=1 FL=1